MAQYGYGGQQNPFDDRNMANNGGPGGGSNVEMSSLAKNASSFGQGDPNAILNECRRIDQGINTIEQNLQQMKMLQQRALDDADSSASSSTNRQLDALSTETMSHYRGLVEQVRIVKSQSDASLPKNAPQINRVDRRLKQAIQLYQQVESGFRKKTQDQMARQYRIVRPDADEREVQEAVEDPTGGQVFQQALMQSNRRGQAQSVLSAVQDRHAQLQKIEQQMIELAQLFQDMDTLVVQQDVAVANIEQKAEETVENFDKGNEQIGTAINTARATRKKKWWCFAIVVAILAVIAIIVVIYVVINKPAKQNNAKRDLVLSGRSLHGRELPQLLTERDLDDYEAVKRWAESGVESHALAGKKARRWAQVGSESEETKDPHREPFFADGYVAAESNLGHTSESTHSGEKPSQQRRSTKKRANFRGPMDE